MPAKSATSPKPKVAWPKRTSSTPAFWWTSQKPSSLRLFPSRILWSRNSPRWSKHRTHLLTQVTQNENLRATVTEPKLRALLTKTATFLQKQAEQLHALMAAKVTAAPSLKVKVSRLPQIQGLGPLTATTLLALMPELGSLSDLQAAALCRRSF